ncbi:MAG: hypothetical protein PF690_05565 [Deltaproteobacteria bacterium]|jgi:hypothetical protein|nr:hypothetical protein [Deltaproteobacteria bacterium]
MKTIAILTGVLTPVSAFAATGLIENGSSIFVWAFLGYCALLVVVQAIPAVLLFTSMVKVIVSVITESFAV